MLTLPDAVTVVDVSARDGLQSFHRWVDTDVKVAMVDRLSEVGFPVVEVTNFAHPRVIPHLEGRRRSDGAHHPQARRRLSGAGAQSERGRAGRCGEGAGDSRSDHGERDLQPEEPEHDPGKGDRCGDRDVSHRRRRSDAVRHGRRDGDVLRVRGPHPRSARAGARWDGFATAASGGTTTPDPSAWRIHVMSIR